MKKLILLLAFFSVIHVEALLPPLYQSAAEIKSIMEDKQLGQKLTSGDLITKIERNDQGYLISTNKHTLQVYVQYGPAEQPGPAQYMIRFGEAIGKGQ